jgi:dTDP-4-dehydrorhamnose reductase
MKILITGAGGMLGTDLLSAFEKSCETVAIQRSSNIKSSVSVHTGDLAEANFAHDVLKLESPNYVFHAAGMTNVDGCELNLDQAKKDNLIATENLVQACNESGAFLIFFSTDYVFDGKKQGEYTEEDFPEPLNQYGETKFLAETYIQRFSKNYLIFRISWLYGIHGKSFPRTLLQLAETKKQFEIVDDQIGRPTFSKDVAKTMALLLQNEKKMNAAKNQIFHLGNEGQVSWAEFGEFILETAGLNIPVYRIKTEQLDRPARRPKNSVLSLNKIKRTFGVELRSWKEAFQEFYTDYQKSLKQAAKAS